MGTAACRASILGTFRDVGSSRSPSMSLVAFLHQFRPPEASKNDNLASFLRPFQGHGAHGRTALSLQSQHDLEGSGRSKNRWFLDVSFGREKHCIWDRTFTSFCDFRRPGGAHWDPKGTPKWHLKSKN